MDSQSNQSLEDDDLEMLEEDPHIIRSTHTLKSTTAGTNASIGNTSFKNKSMDDVVDDNEPLECKKPKTNASEVWNHFEKVGLKDGVEKCKCKSCGNFYTCKASSGTAHLRRHFIKCFKTPKFHDVGALLDSQATLLKKWKFDPMAYRDALARCIIMHDLPFNYAEYDGVCALNTILNPDFTPVSRNTAKIEVTKVYLIEKAKLKGVLANIPGRICLTSDAWTAVTTQGYMTVTAHYVDEKWALNSKLLAFCELDSPHTGEELSGHLLRVLEDWGISSKIFSLTLDNASSNDKMQKLVKERLNAKKGLLCRGEFFHVRCCAHILNLIVQDGIRDASKFVEKIRESVKYVKGSEGRLKLFKRCIVENNLGNVGGGFLRLDVSTRWNATYLMLESAIKYRFAFHSMCYYDKNFKCCPNDEEWERGEKMRLFLAPFYSITNVMSGSYYPTSNLYFTHISNIQMKLKEGLTSEDLVIQEMASRMMFKFEKYWESCCLVLAFGSVFEPASKFHYVKFVYKKLYPETCDEKVNMIKEAMHRLYSEYEQSGVASSSSRVVSSYSQAHSIGIEDLDDPITREYKQQRSQITSVEGRSQLERYLEEDTVDMRATNVLDYWKVNKHRFPVLAIMACDVLSIPITTVASESSFSIGSRILNKYRSCLLPDNLQALICTRNWLHGFKEIVSSDALEIEEIPLQEEENSNVQSNEV